MVISSKKKTLDDEFNSEKKGVSNFAFGERIKVKKKIHSPETHQSDLQSALQALGLFLALVIPESKMTSSSSSR